jgi:LemA protein
MTTLALSTTRVSRAVRFAGVSIRAMLNLVVPIILAVLLAWAIIVFNLLIRDRNRVSQSWSDVDVQLMRRHDLVPRLVELVKGYSGYEKSLQTSVAEIRGQAGRDASPAARGEAEKSVAAGVSRLVALVEAYPDLKASENFLDLQKQLADTENQIQYARRYYNGAVNLYNNRLQRFPDLLIANAFAFRRAEFFQLDDDAKAAAPAVSLP